MYSNKAKCRLFYHTHYHIKVFSFERARSDEKNSYRGKKLATKMYARIRCNLEKAVLHHHTLCGTLSCTLHV